MNTHLRQLLLASTFAATTVGVSAQTAPATTPTPAPTTQAQTQTKPEPTTQAQRDYDAAKAACQTEHSRNARLECLRRADDAYNRGTGGIPMVGNGVAASGTGSNARAAHSQ